MRDNRLPPGQQLVGHGKWPLVGEREPACSDAPYLVEVAGLVRHPMLLSLAELRLLRHITCVVDIHCVTRWSKLGVTFGGVLLTDVLHRCVPAREARFVSFVARSARQHSTSLPLAEALNLGVMLAWEAEHAPLPAQHGGPVRIVAPGRYFYKSLKWLAKIELLPEDRLGYWEAEAGYHNTADPWREQRYMAPARSRQEAARLLAARDFSGRDLRSIDASGRDLRGLRARGALLRDADFRGCQLERACFEGANLSNARLDAAVLRGASFRNADVEGASFVGADLRGADFTGASLLGASFCDEGPHGREALLDATTRFEAAQLESLTPVQQAFLENHLIRAGLAENRNGQK